ncbi:hypothetical protein [Methylophilus methylotrophus]|uniref:hypothetical protein n=1 Tax=Methylophilus methylotrophus TaxID=17 RepID=UPI001B7FD4CA|nr:hypothetical protein [Methylophilus methylotrophus]
MPIGRVSNPDEVAKAVAFLASPEATFINGIEFLWMVARRRLNIAFARVLKLNSTLHDYNIPKHIPFDLAVYKPSIIQNFGY